MVEDAEAQGANAVVSARFTTSMVQQNAAETERHFPVCRPLDQSDAVVT